MTAVVHEMGTRKIHLPKRLDDAKFELSLIG
jgi:hypothetical protein